ncbi:hypothetical protein [Allomuricauda sp. R78024]|uniref:hypothetical protein n=1 Tax=Allomuricauda sp. R78024 TaxID=3093867 RepID=UPI0037C5F1F7
MKNLFTLLFSLVISISASSQGDFEPGYFIDDNDNKLECLIQNEKWFFSPEEVFYKLNENSEVKSFTIEQCTAFGIGKEISFRAINTEIPITQSKINNKDDVPEPRLVKKRQFARVLLQGKVPLYQIVNGEETVFLTKNSDGQIESLLYKEYLDNSLIKKNNLFKRQLLKNYNCEKPLDIQSLKYERKSVLSYFVKLNECLGDFDYKIYDAEPRQKFFSLVRFKILAGLQHTDYEAKSFTQTFDFDNEISVKVGIEVEAFIGDLKKQKTSIFLNLQYSNIQNMLNLPPTEFNETTLKLSLNALETSVGLRHYFNITDKNSIFLDAGFLVNFYLDATLDQESIFNGIIARPPETNKFAPISRSNDVVPSLGIGYSYNKRAYLRFNYLIGQNLVDGDVQGASVQRDNLSQISLSLGYTL